MKIDKAIEILDAIVLTGEYEGDPVDRPALKLGIEALKVLPKYRKSHRDARYALLPGETQE